VIMLRGIVAILVLAFAASVSAQQVDESALDAFDKSPAIQPLVEPAGAAQLRAAMRRISYNSSDADALADAGDASLTLGDADAALNFFTRANSLRPRNGRIVSGLATATVRTENPFEALRLFDDAVRLGVSEHSIAADRALAFDLLGNFERAQQDYRLARSFSSSDDLLIKQAISLSLAGQKAEADAMLVPLLQKNSPPAWRARAFMLASRGDFRESAKVTQGFMDAASAQRMERYLRLMPELTGAQRAAAIHLGHFPASQYVGRDSEDVRLAASTIAQALPGATENRLIPAGAPLGKKVAQTNAAKPLRKSESKNERQASEREEVSAAAAQIAESLKLPRTDGSRLGTDSARAKVEEAQVDKIASVSAGGMPSPESARPPVRIILPSRAGATGSPPVQAESTNAEKTILPIPLPQATSSNAFLGTASSAATQTVAPPLNILPDMVSNNVSTGSPAIGSAVPAAPAFDLAAIVGSIEIPESEQKLSAVPVDLKKIKSASAKAAVVESLAKAAKADPKAVAKTKTEVAQPARFWVQIATGDARALGIDYRRWSKKTPALFKSQTGWTSQWGKTDRLLVGPFADTGSAKKWENDFKKAGGDGFMWKSENGVVVTALKSK
jgi:Flp pilus assembly protein TadD